MANRYSALHQEFLWREEVLYLHNLWRQGPSGASPSRPKTNPNSTRNYLRPGPSFKPNKHWNRRHRRKKAVVWEKEWPCETDPKLNSGPGVTGWPRPLPKPVPPAPTAEDIATAAAFCAQRNGVEAYKLFFSRKGRDGSVEEGDEGSELEEEDEEVMEERAFKFFIDVFTKDDDLRKCYELNSHKGEFLCLVCRASGLKKERTYGRCADLVQHCSSLAKTRRRGAHRGLARAICRVVGWNFSRLPMFVLDTEDTLGQALARDSCQEKKKKAERTA
ncbi:hypothetical protein HPP92_012423 [Vanilla planifolia]|uniref:Uncharacterized protein n=1 Tax=Vanilla planifolia TaxID=51239 RepID=A0A835QWV5_VANPL|nr:hypothetical protein HPP92_012423 [Vanilla planifolia]